MAKTQATTEVIRPCAVNTNQPRESHPKKSLRIRQVLRKRASPFASEQKGVSKAERREETATMRRADPKLERPRGI